MSKNTFFTGQPIFSQLLNYIPRNLVSSIAQEQGADRYCKSFRTYEHLVTMLYGVFNQCTSLREITTGLLAWDQRIGHLGITIYPRRSTLADANERRSHLVFEKIYLELVRRYQSFLPDSRLRHRKKNVYFLDSTIITLFAEVLKGSGLPKANGRQKGGIKVHTLLRSDLDVPVLVRFSAAAANDVTYLKEVRLPKHSVIVFDRGYRNYEQYNRMDQQQLTWVTRHRDNSALRIIEDRVLKEQHIKAGVLSDRHIILGTGTATARARMVEYRNPQTGKQFRFITNNRQLSPVSIAGYYQQRWQIEVFFKRIKQNYPLHYFLGDSANATQIQIWCALIADLLLKLVQRHTQTSRSFSNITGLVRLHLMTYMDIYEFLRSPEKSLLARIKKRPGPSLQPSLFSP